MFRIGGLVDGDAAVGLEPLVFRAQGVGVPWGRGAGGGPGGGGSGDDGNH